MPMRRQDTPAAALRRRSALEPASTAVPAATEKNQHDDDDNQKCRRVHAALLTRPPTEAGLRDSGGLSLTTTGLSLCNAASIQ
jgi:hypothetical protein